MDNQCANCGTDIVASSAIYGTSYSISTLNGLRHICARCVVKDDHGRIVTLLQTEED